MWFNEDLQNQISVLINSIENDEFSLPDNWQWTKQIKHKLEDIEDKDIVLIKKLQELHDKGLDIPELSLIIITKAKQLRTFISLLESQKGLDQKTQKEELKRLKIFTKEIDILFQQELKSIKESQNKSLHEGRVQAIPKKCRSFFFAESNIAESKRKDFTKFLNEVGRDPSELYKFLRTRFSGFVGNEELIRDYLKGSKRTLLDSFRLELLKIQREVPKIQNVVWSSGTGWNHFILNGDSEQHRGFKSYITFDYHTFTANAFILAVKVLAKSGFKGQIKIYQPEVASMQLQQDDNIVIHGDDSNLITRAAQIIIKILEKNGVHIGGGSRTSKFNIAQDFIVPNLPALGLKSHDASFSEGIAEIACEILINSVKASKQYLKSYNDFRKFLDRLYADDGPFVQYLHQINIIL